MTSSLPNYLRSHRQKSRLTQDEIGVLLGGVHGSTITRHEEYHRIPSLTVALGYAAIYSADPRELFAGRYELIAAQIRERAERLLAISADDHDKSHDKSDTEPSQSTAFLYRLAHAPDSYLVPCLNQD